MIDVKTIPFPKRLMAVQQNSFRLQPMGEIFTSAYSPIPRSTGPRYNLWTCSISMNVLCDAGDFDQRFEWEAFVHSLDGTAVAMALFDAFRCLPRGVGAGISVGSNPDEYFRVANGVDYSLATNTRLLAGSTFANAYEDAPRNSQDIVLSGLVPNADVFKPGDLMSIGGNLHEVQLLARSDANGRSAVRLNNRLWKPVLAGDIVELSCPTGRFVMKDNDQGTAIRGLVTSSTSAEMVEFPYVE